MSISEVLPLKVLKLFTELVKNGHPEFRQNLLKQTVPLNDASSKKCYVDKT